MTLCGFKVSQCPRLFSIKLTQNYMYKVLLVELCTKIEDTNVSGPKYVEFCKIGPRSRFYLLGLAKIY
jgi:hypothetical protein